MLGKRSSPELHSQPQSCWVYRKLAAWMWGRMSFAPLRHFTYSPALKAY
jgi:hypothetical protein